MNNTLEVRILLNFVNEILTSYKKPVPHSEIDPCLTMMYRFFVRLRAVKSNFLLFQIIFEFRTALKIKHC